MMDDYRLLQAAKDMMGISEVGYIGGTGSLELLHWELHLLALGSFSQSL